MTPTKAIRLKCLDCMCGLANEVKLCPITDCSLYPFRFGKNPNIKREFSEEQRKLMGEQLKNANIAKKAREMPPNKNPK